MAKKIEITSLMKIGNKDKFLKELTKEMQEDVRYAAKAKIKNKIKEIAMTEEILKKQKKELGELLSGKCEVLSKEEYLFA